MPKRIGYIYDRMCDKDLIRQAIIKGSEGKKKRHEVIEVLGHIDKYVDKTYDLLVKDEYKPTPPKVRKIKDRSSGKWRIISMVPFYPDGILHQLSVMAMKDVLMRGMYRWSCASIPKRGNACARKYVRRAMDRDKRKTKYCAKMDIYHFYPNVSIDIMMAALQRKIKDKRFLTMVRKILDSNTTGGLAIGFYVNQWLANFLLEAMDNHILTLDGVHFYVRNMDDIVILGANKRKLHRAIESISDFLTTRLELRLKGNYQVFPVDARGVDFIGYRFYHDHTGLRRTTFLRFTRQCRKVGRTIRRGRRPSYRTAAGLLSRVGSLKHCNCVQARKKHYGVLNRRLIKGIVRLESIRRTLRKGGSSAESNCG